MMSLWLSRLSLLALVLSVVVGIGYSQQHTIKTLRMQRDQAQQRNAEKNALIQALHQQARAHETTQLALQEEISQIRQAHAQRETLIRSAYETPTVRRWAHTPLPQSVIRLREHGPFTRARAYVEHLPNRESLHAPCRAPQNQR